MSENTALPSTTGIPTASKVLCAAYATIAIAALVAYWSQSIAYFAHPKSFLTALAVATVAFAGWVDAG